jgi:hypothetical protein
MASKKDDCNHVLSVDCVQYFDVKFKDLEEKLDMRAKLADSLLVGKKDLENQLTEIKSDLSVLTKVVYVGMGVIAALQAAWDYIKR